ncbi:mutS protein homolog 4 [Trichonephila inaurata madagascariensis]|uniref:MutS protein homolog 4 n=1 Tax=Trichonephila inaurata madagascariensis TaxID=2747483 RepID=A0A8X6MJU4_9ARAC|nr:mutS protein homolog 4 [Trichonephila inaurata madagascariensis]
MSETFVVSKSQTPGTSGEEELSQNNSKFLHPAAYTDATKKCRKQWSTLNCNSAQRTGGRQSSTSLSTGERSSVSKSSTTPQSCANTKIVAIVEGRGIARGEIGMACIDIKNPVLLLSQFADTQAYLRLAVQLNVLKPFEVVMPNTSLEHGSKTKLLCRIRELFPEMTTVTVQRKYFNETKGLQYIQELCASEYKTVEIEVSPKYYCLAACAALLKFFEFKQNVTFACNSLKVVYCTSADTTMISMATARHLELVTNELGKVEHCLYGILNHTLTPDCISELIDKEELFYDLKSVIGKFVDTEHLLSLCIQIPKEENVRNCEQKIANVICMKHTLELVKPLRNCLESCSNALFQTYFQILSDERFLKLQEKIGLVIHTDAQWQKGVLNMHMQKCFAVKPNINGLLDVARRAYSESVNDVSDIVKQLEKQYNLPLQVGYSAMCGFFIQIPCKLMPAEKILPQIFLKVNKYKNFITCTTEDLLFPATRCCDSVLLKRKHLFLVYTLQIKLNDRIQESLNEIYLMSDIIINEVLNEIREHIGCLYNLTEAVSSIDFLLSLAHVYTLSDHVRPEFSTSLAIKNGRHPVIEKICGTTFMPNNAFLCEEMNFMILTGANMSGKSTYLKQLAVLQIMAQMGSYVPAEFASFRIADQILTRIGSSSDIEKNYSTFMLQEQILKKGCAIAYAICEELLKTKAFVLCSTHFSQLTQLASVYPNVENYHFSVEYILDKTKGCTCNFTHTLTPGPCKEKYYGIKIAEISTLPQSIVLEAKRLVTTWSETRSPDSEDDVSYGENKEKIKLAIHLIQLAQQDTLFDLEGLKEHLRNLQAQFKINTTVSPHSDDI